MQERTLEPRSSWPDIDPTSFYNVGQSEAIGNLVDRLEQLVGRLEALDRRRRPGAIAVYQSEDIEAEARKAGLLRLMEAR